MEFKKHFSSNLQNLAVKKTLVMQPPPQMDKELSLSSRLMSSRGSNSPFQKHRHCSSALNELGPSDKENQPYNHIPLSNIVECRSSSQQKTRERQLQGSPILTFQAIKQGFLEKEHVSSRKVFLPCENYKLTSGKKEISQGLKQSNSLAQLGSRREPNISNNVRLGSMVFSSLSKKNPDLPPKIVGRDSRSFEQSTRGKSQFPPQIECMNNDGHQAKYKVVKIQSEQNEQMLHYCFNCAIPLVKQGFSVEQLTIADKQLLGRNKGQRDAVLEDMRQSYSTRQTEQEARMRIGQQLKSKVILKINKVKACRENFQASFGSTTESIDTYYDSLINLVEEQRKKEHLELTKTKNKVSNANIQQKNEPQRYEQQLSSSLGTLDYLLKHPQGLVPSCLQEIEQLLGNEVCYPQTQAHLSSKQNLQGKIQYFQAVFQENFTINYRESGEDSRYQSRRYTHGGESSMRSIKTEQSELKGNSHRFSFQSALQESKTNRGRRTLNSYYEMNPLQEQNQSQLQDSLQDIQQRRDAFRNLFPEENEDNQFADEFQRATQSPNFKEF